LATSRSVFTKETAQGLNILCDIGSDTTEISFFRDGSLFHIEILPFGGSTLTKELQESFKIPFELAEDIKRSHGAIADASHIAEDKEILVKKSNLYKPIKQKMVLELLAPKARHICVQIKEAVEKTVSRYEINNFFVVGRTLLLEGFIEAVEQTLSLPVKIGRLSSASAMLGPLQDDDSLAGQKYLTYLTCLGMCREQEEGKTRSPFVPAEQPAAHILTRAITKLKEVYQEYF
jgi:cell division ATPase FtsA